MNTSLKTKSNTIEKLAKEGSLAHLYRMKPMLCLKSTNPTPLIIAYRAFHHRATAIFFELAVALGALVKNNAPINCLI